MGGQAGSGNSFRTIGEIIMPGLMFNVTKYDSVTRGQFDGE